MTKYDIIEMAKALEEKAENYRRQAHRHFEVNQMGLKDYYDGKADACDEMAATLRLRAAEL